jgi:hypothetical protein
MDCPQVCYYQRSLLASACPSPLVKLLLSPPFRVSADRGDLEPASKLLPIFVFVHFSRFQSTCAFPPSQVFLSPWHFLFQYALFLWLLPSAASRVLSNAPFPTSLARAIAPFLTSQLGRRLLSPFLCGGAPSLFPPFLLLMPRVPALLTSSFPLPSGARVAL